MGPFLGSLQLVGLLLAVAAAFAVALVSALLGGVLGSAVGNRWVTAILSVGLLGATIAVAELVSRARAARRQPRWVIDLSALRSSKVLSNESLGGDAESLAQAARLGVAIPDTVVLTAELVEQWLASLRTARRGSDPLTLLPAGARGPLQAFVHRCQGGKISVRPSFSGSELNATYPGVFHSVSDVDAGNLSALVAALVRVVDSGYSAAATEYRRKLHVGSPLRRAVILQRQVAADVSGTAQSRGLDGRGDSIVIDFSKGRSASVTVSFDLLDGTLLAVAPDVPLETTPSWMNRLAGLVVALDTQLGATVLLDFAVEHGQLYLLALRRVQMQERTTWVSDGGPLEAESDRLPRFVREAYGDTKALREATNEALGKLGAVEESELRDEDGVRYLNMAVLRRALGQLALAVLLEEPLWQLFALSRPIAFRSLAKIPDVSGDLPASFRQFRAWQTRSLAPLVTARMKLGVRRWLVEWVIGMLADGSTGEAVPRVHRMLRKQLSRDAGRFASHADRAKTQLGEVEQQLRDFAAQIIARGATDWNAVFVGDRHLHAGVEELGRWTTEPGVRDELGAQWDRQKTAFEARRLVPVPPRIIEPPPPASLMSQADSRLRVVGMVPGTAEGLAVAASELKSVAPQGCIVVLTDGRSEHAAHVLKAGGVVIAGGGLLSPMGQLARELDIPTVACIDRVTLARFTLGQPASIDGTRGGMVF